jgi:hypothetical protein
MSRRAVIYIRTSSETQGENSSPRGGGQPEARQVMQEQREIEMTVGSDWEMIS